ncbi:DNA polymerase delta, subunit 4-domain-containing protein [Biscogniauxia mediterranea]|nr:DNA polymerase delta, subunit 4-domain-containing protein [Biscogniauxia mediterranea]
MPVTRRTTRSSTAGSGARQSTLSFHHRVTKASAAKGAKDLSAPAKSASPPAKHVPSAQPVKEEQESESESEAEEEEEEEEREREKQKEEEEKTVEEAPKSEAEVRARKVTARQIDQYWRRLERDRLTRRVHQEGLSLAEKVLRYWDVSSQYGPCVGISRMKRWQRADRLGLNPPVEVLAVLMKENNKGTQGIANAHMDEILSSTSIGAI